MNSRRNISRRVFSAVGFAGLAGSWLPHPSLRQESRVGEFVSSDEEKANVEVVEKFCAAWGKKDLDTIASSLADDCSFRPNQKSPAIIGKQMVVERFQSDFKRASFELKILRTAALGPVVLTERDDTISSFTDSPRTIHIAAGMFFLSNERIVEWTDFGPR